MALLEDVDLFAGAGGATVGMIDANHRPISYDNWQLSIDTHKLNGLLPIVKVDLCEKDWDPRRGCVNVMWASPPCQPFSQSGPGKGSKDKRDCVPAWLMALRDARPRVSIMENVRGLTFKRHAHYWAWVVSTAESYGYQVEYRVLNCADYGIPQKRLRTILIAREDGLPKWPEKDPCTITMAEALGWGEPRCLYPNDELAWWPFERVAATVVGSFRPEVMARPAWRNAGDGPRQKAPGSVIITLEEAAKLQGFPDGYRFAGEEKDQWQQVGNAVPPLLVQRLVEANAD